MPFRNPFFFSKRALGRIDKIREQQEKELENGPPTPPKVNNFTTTNKLTVGKSRNVHTPIKKDEGPGEKAQEINNLEANKPVMATSLNEYPAPTIKPRDIQELIPAVNGKAAPHLVHKPDVVKRGQDFFPVIEGKKKSKRPGKKGSTKKTP